MLARRTGGKKESLPAGGAGRRACRARWTQMQRDLLETARARREANSIRGATKEQFLAHWRATAGSSTPASAARRECEAEIKEQTKATIRVLPDEEFRSPQRRRPACGAEGRAWRRRCGPRRTERGGGPDQARAVRRRRARAARRVAVPRRRGARRRSRTRSARRPTSTTPTSIRRQLRARSTRRSAPVPHRIAFAVKANSNLAVLRVLRDLGAGRRHRLRRRAGPGARRRLRSRTASSSAGSGRPTRSSTAAVDGRHRPHPPRVAAELDALARIAERLGRPMRGRHPGESRRHGRHPSRTSRPGRAGSSSACRSTRWCRSPSRSRHASRCSRSTPSRCTSAASCSTPRPTRKASAGCWSWWRSSAAPGSTSIARSTSAAASASATATRRRSAPAALAAAVLPLVRDSGLTVTLEPGRYLVGSAGVLLTTVLSRKHSGGKDLVIVDAGMNDLVRPSHYMAYHEMVGGGAPRTAECRGGRRRPGLRDGRLPGPRPRAARRSSAGSGSPCSAPARTASSWLELQHPASAGRGDGGRGSLVGGAAAGAARRPVPDGAGDAVGCHPDERSARDLPPASRSRQDPVASLGMTSTTTQGDLAECPSTTTAS